MNVRLAIVYYSGHGHTAKMAEAVAQGAAAVRGTVLRHHALRAEDLRNGLWSNDVILADLDASHAIVFGTPTYMGGPAAVFKAFADATSERWYNRAWLNKLAAGFTVSGGLSGDKLSTLQYLVTFAMQHGMVWVGQAETPFNDRGINRLNGYLGAMGQAMTEPPEVAPGPEDRLTGETLGRRVAELTWRWVQGGEPSR